MRSYIFMFLVFSVLQCKSQGDMKLIYVGDPMCSWCYGIAPELEKVIDEQKDNMDVEFVMGGLRPHFDKKMIEMKSFLTEHWQQVNQATQQPFNYKILDDAQLAYDTEPPCRAVVTVRKINPKSTAEFFKRTQEQFYVDNLDMNVSKSYHSNLKALGIDIKQFDKMFSSQEMKSATAADFQRAQELNVRSFPTILLEYKNKVYKVCNGYEKAVNINTAIDNIILSQN